MQNVNLKLIIDILRELKIHFITVLIACLVIGTLFAYIDKPKWVGSIKLYPISSINFAPYENFTYQNKIFVQNFALINQNVLKLLNFKGREPKSIIRNEISKERDETKLLNIDQNGIDFFPEFIITSDSLINLLGEEISDRAEALEILDKIYSSKKENFNSIDEYNLFLSQVSYNLNILHPIITPEAKQVSKRDYQEDWIIKYKAENKNEILQVLEYVIINSNTKVREHLQSSFQDYIRLYEESIQSLIVSNLRDRAYLIEDYMLFTKQRLEFLNENFMIARQLEIEQNSVNLSNIYTDSDSVAIMQQDLPYYLLGYPAIEEEIKLIKSRKDPEMYIPQLVDIDRKIKIYKDFINNQNLFDYFKTTPVYSEKFIAADYDIGNISISKIGFSDTIIIFFSFIISILIFSIFFIIRLIKSIIS